jgi:prevent-host-death family protein
VETVGIRELKAHLSRHLRRVRDGSRLVVTDRGQQIATIAPVETPDAAAEIAWARRLVAERLASWSGGKPRGAGRRLALSAGNTVASTILDDRR